MSIRYQHVVNYGLAKNLLSKHLDHGFTQMFLLEAELLGKKAPEDFNMEESVERCKDLSDSILTYILATEGDKLAGILAVYPDDPREIQMIWVEPEYRKKGVGRKLIKRFQKHVAPLPLKVECLKVNETALDFYKKLGFTFVDKARYITNLVGYTKVKL